MQPKTSLVQVPCSTSSDCYSRCGEHPLSGFSYVCTPHPLFYTFHVVNETLTEETLAIELAAQDLSPGIPVTADFDSFDTRLALLEARPKWIPKPDTVSTQSYFVDEPGACFGHEKTIAFLKLTLRSVLIFVTHRREQVRHPPRILRRVHRREDGLHAHRMRVARWVDRRRRPFRMPVEGRV
jgi:hypothetical protein